MNGRFHAVDKLPSNPWAIAQSRVRSSARVRRSNISSISCAGDDERRTKRQGVAGKRAHDQALRFGEGDAARADALLRLERLLGALVADHLEAADEAEAARFADQRMLAELLQAALELRSDRRDFSTIRSRA